MKTRGRKRFPAKTEGWNLCDIELPRQMFNSIFVVDVCLQVCFQHLVFVLFNFIFSNRHSDG